MDENPKNESGKGYLELALTSGVLIGLASLFIPVPSFLLDFLLAFNLVSSILLLLLVLHVKSPLEFTSFPGLVLIYTLLRLSLGVGCTRAILGQGYAGEIISSFGGLLIRGDYAAGLLILLILFLIQFLVITKGTNRTSEVIARFFLDSLPGKQMAIEGELSSGMITQEEAKRKRGEVSRQGDFYGSMDGAVKFIRGDAILTFVLILINLGAGFVIGLWQKGMAYQEAFRTYALLSAGLGLALQIPALLISSASGLLVTRSSTKESLARDFIREYIPQPDILIPGIFFLALIGIFSGFSIITLLSLISIGGVLGYFSIRKTSGKYQADKTRKMDLSEETGKAIDGEEPEPLTVDPLRIELGYGLIPLAQSSSEDNLFQTIPILRRELAAELGIKLPKVRVRDNINLKPLEYSIILKEVELARGELFRDRLLAINPGGMQEIEGIGTIEPAFGFPAKWINPNRKEEAEARGYSVVEPKAVLTTHLAELIRENVPEIFGLQETKDLLEELKSAYPALVEEVYPQNLPLTVIQKILQNLLRENVPIKDLLTIFEVLAEKSPETKDPLTLTELVRAGLKRTITQRYLDPEGKISVFTLDPKLEQNFVSPEGLSTFKLGLKPEIAERIVSQSRLKAEELKNRGVKPAVLLSSRIRLPFRKFIQDSLPELGVLSYEEIIPRTRLFSVGNISLEDELSRKVKTIGV
jgi:flagellar biosynthesis protein FlhA